MKYDNIIESFSPFLIAQEREEERPGSSTGMVPIPRWKRGLDLSFFLLALPYVLLIFGFIAVWIKLTSSGSLFYRQERIGKGGVPFVMFKFRTMKETASTDSHDVHMRTQARLNLPMIKLDSVGDSRMIPGGRWIRASGFDELPQLFNILRGETSFVGPRPCIPKEYDLFSRNQRARFDGVPGMTGYWQVRGKNKTTFSEMVALDIEYLERCSLLFDVKIILRTPLTLVSQMTECVRSGWNKASKVAG